MEEYETIIVGAGIAGLACARTLHSSNKKFKIITEDIGGRIKTSKNGRVNYGAYLVTADYNHLMPYITKNRRQRISDLHFHKRNNQYSFYSVKLLPYTLQIIRLLVHVYKFRRRYSILRKETERISQREAILKDSYLKKLYFQTAEEFAREIKIAPFCHQYLCEGLYPVAFTTVDQMTAFTYLHFLQPLIIPMYAFTFEKERLIKGFKKEFIKAEVIDIKREKSVYRIRTRQHADYYAKNVVVATPVTVSKRLLNIKKYRGSVNAYVFHIDGTIRKKFSIGKAQLFDVVSEVFAILQNEDGSYLLYSKTSKPKIGEFFSSYKIKGEHYWKPAEFMRKGPLLESKRGKNL